MYQGVVNMIREEGFWIDIDVGEKPLSKPLKQKRMKTIESTFDYLKGLTDKGIICGFTVLSSDKEGIYEIKYPDANIQCIWDEDK